MTEERQQLVLFQTGKLRLSQRNRFARYPPNLAFCAVLGSLVRSISAPVAPLLPSGFTLPLSRLSSNSPAPCSANSLCSSLLEQLSRDRRTSAPKLFGYRCLLNPRPLEHPILELRLLPAENYPEPGACISPTLGAQSCSLAPPLEKLIFLFF